MDKEVVDKVTNFYLTTSRIHPGDKNVVIMRKPGEEKTKLQKLYLLTTLEEAHAMRHEAHNLTVCILHI